MKNLSPEFAAHLATGATTLCFCWRLVRRDGSVFGFTDHDQPIVFGGLTFEARSGFTASAMETNEGLAVDDLEVSGALISEALSESALARGLFDDADIEIWRVNWQDAAQRVLLRKGNLGEVSRGRAAFVAEVRGLAHRLNQPVGRIYQSVCDADLGDARCQVALTNPAYRGTATVAAAIDARRLRVTGLDAFANGWFSAGTLTWTTGANQAQVQEIRRHAKAAGAVSLELWLPSGLAIAVGDQALVTAGCDKTLATCRAKFSNAVNFRGFPYMPGNDWIIAFPRRGENNDGRSREP